MLMTIFLYNYASRLLSRLTLPSPYLLSTLSHTEKKKKENATKHTDTWSKGLDIFAQDADNKSKSEENWRDSQTSATKWLKNLKHCSPYFKSPLYYEQRKHQTS